ncbi:DUF6313 family protein [Streptomyces sp. NPDC053079]|uniref:DUF6313 family protein n=1 Tax=Streptomyces sp. NPDC053079 TaxID=3365697 RepID=UPI0037CD290A
MSKGAFRNVTVWLALFGLPLTGIWATVMAIASQHLGWGKAYEIMVGISSPVGSPEPGWAWSVSLGGWLFVPALVGGVAGSMIGGRMDRRRSQDTDEIKNEIINGFETMGRP